VARNDVLPQAIRRDDIANGKFLGPRDTSDLISIVKFTFAMRRHSAGSLIVASVYGMCVKTPAIYLSIAWHSFLEMRTATK